MQLKIYDKIYECSSNSSIQTLIGSHESMVYIFDLVTNPEYEPFFIKLFEQRVKFEVSSVYFEAKGVFIKLIDVDFGKKMTITFHSDIFSAKNLSDRREEIIDEILDTKTFNNNKDIN
jgi:hypothetical protein